MPQVEQRPGRHPRSGHQIGRSVHQHRASDRHGGAGWYTSCGGPSRRSVALLCTQSQAPNAASGVVDSSNPPDATLSSASLPR